MSNKNNVNKDFYTMAGRDRPNETIIAPTIHRPDEMPGHSGGAQPNFIPGAAPVGQSPPPQTHETQTSADKEGARSGSRKQATARRDGKAPGKARPKAQDTVRAKRGTTRGDATRRSRRRAA